RLFRIHALRDREYIERGRLRNLAVIAPDLFAVALQDLQLLLRHFRITTTDVAGVAILGDELQCHLRTTAADPERNLVTGFVTLGLIDGLVDGVILAVEGRLVLG